MTMREFFEKQILDLEERISQIRDKIDYNDSISRPNPRLTIDLEDLQKQIDALRRYLENSN